MIRVTSEAICETAGSMMNQQSGKNQHLNPNNFNVEMFLRFNLGPLHKLDGLVAEIFAFNSKKIWMAINPLVPPIIHPATIFFLEGTSVNGHYSDNYR